MKLLDTLKNIGGLIGRVAGGPLGGAVVDGVKQLFGGKSDDEVAQLLASSDPQALALIRQYEIELQKHLATEARLVDEAYLDDRQNARTMQIQTGSTFPQWFAVGLLICCALLFGVIIFVPLSGEKLQTVNVLFGMMLSFLGMAVAYYYGSSKRNDERS